MYPGQGKYKQHHLNMIDASFQNHEQRWCRFIHTSPLEGSNTNIARSLIFRQRFDSSI